MDNELRLCGIPTQNLQYIWDFVKDLLEQAILYSDDKYTLESVYEALLDEEMQLWVIMDTDDAIYAALVTQIVWYPAKKVLFMMFVAGVSFNEWQDVIHHFERFALEHHCNSIEAYGRHGWEKLLKPLGFTRIHTVYRLDLQRSDH